jgi:guanyl-specific ribonuclease Sa
MGGGTERTIPLPAAAIRLPAVLIARLTGLLPRLIGLLALLGLLGGLLLGCSTGTATAPRASSTSAGSSAAAAGSSAAPNARGTAPNRAASCPAPSSSTPGAGESHLPLRALCALPPEVAQVWRTIATGGRLTYSRDGIVFNNAERLLPAHPRGYYHEYTVPTPGSRDRGARRLVTGQGHEVYYTGDHYASFFVVDPTASASN